MGIYQNWMRMSLKQKVLKYLTNSDNETIEFGKRVGNQLIEGDVIALVGELGSGKTWLAKGLALGLGVSPDIVITSPSFSLVNEYEGRYPFYHIDLYRLEGIADLQSAGIDHYLNERGVVAIEWADRWPGILPVQRIWVKLAIMNENHRQIILSGKHPHAQGILRSIEKEI